MSQGEPALVERRAPDVESTSGEALGRQTEAASGRDAPRVLRIARTTWCGQHLRAIVDSRVFEGLRARLGDLGVFQPLRELDSSSRVASKGKRALFRVDASKEGEFDGDSLILMHERFPFPTWLLTLPIEAKGFKERRNLRIVERLGLPVVSPVAAGEVGWGPFFFETYVATREIPGGYNFSQWRRDRSGRAKKAFPRDEVVRALPRLARVIARLHRERFYCRTAFGKNVLIHRLPDGEIEFALHDLPRARYFPGRELELTRAVNDLACLDKGAIHWMSRGERLHFLRAYLDELGEGPEFREWARLVTRRRDLLLRRTFWSWFLHRVRRRGKKLPLVGKWIR